LSAIFIISPRRIFTLRLPLHFHYFLSRAAAAADAADVYYFAIIR
jgi:hypothetical protein